MLNANKLNGKIIENGLDKTTVAEMMGIHRSTLHRKINNEGDKLSVKEANELVKILKLSSEEAMSIFCKLSRMKCEKQEKCNERIKKYREHF